MNVYCIVSVNDITNDMIAEAVNDADSLRYSVDNTKAVLKFATSFPNSMKGYIKYSTEDILPILATSEWTMVD